MNNIKSHKKIGAWLRKKRELAGFSKAQLARLSGYHKSFVSRYEAGQRMDIIQFTKIALALNAKPCEVIESCIEDSRKKSNKSAKSK
jgi:transcriptional regulator with XRE-family HTH domain